MLRNVGAPTGMLETVVAEKTIGRAGLNSSNQAGAATSSPQQPTRSNTLTANQRLKGLLSGRSSAFSSNSDRSFPSGNRTPSPPPVPPQADKPRTLTAASSNSLSHLAGSSSSLIAARLSQDQLTNDSSQLSLPMSVSPTEGFGGTQGFRQVGALPSPNLDPTSLPSEDVPK